MQVALALMDNPDARQWGYETRRRSGVRSGVMYPVLQRMLEQGWLADGWEDQPRDGRAGRPPRRYYELTQAGKTELAALLEQARNDPRFRSLFPAPEEPHAATSQPSGLLERQGD